MIIRGASWCDLVKHADGRVEFVSLIGTRVECAQRWVVDAGQALLYLRAAADTNGRVCAIGQGHQDGLAWATIEGGTVLDFGATHGVFPVLIFGDSLGWVAYIQRTASTYDVIRLHAQGGHVRLATHQMPPTSQGFLFVASNGTPITQDLGRNAIVGPDFLNTDFSVTKNTKITERFTLQFRSEFFDIFNRPNFGNPVLTATSASFGQIQSTRFPTGDFGSARQIQFALKLLF